jgi:hypothetical protein
VRILEIAPDSDLRSLKIRELEQINWAIANFDEALTGAAGKAGAIVSRDVFDMGEAEQGFRARTRRRVQLEATRVQRPEIYNAAPWPIDDFPSGVSIAQAWYGRLPGSYRRVLLDCDKEADNMAFVSAQRTASHGAAWHRAYSDSYGNALRSCWQRHWRRTKNQTRRPKWFLYPERRQSAPGLSTAYPRKRAVVRSQTRTAAFC